MPDIQLESEIWDNTLTCPCGGENLHHDQVEVFFRNGEDDDHGNHVTTGHKRLAVDQDMLQNPSSRRDGLLIYFYCEHCDRRPVLRIIQHKGSTYVGWRK